MVFSSVNNPLYLDPQNWHQQQQQNYDQASSGSRGENPHPPALPPPAAQPGGSSGIRPGSMADRARLAKIPQPETGLKCPRCESTNTKFCYFNNYNLSQPRHFCKTCRRYWTRGGALRNVPVGGGCRRNKRTRSRTSKSPAAAVAAGSIVNISAPSSVTTISSAATEHQLMTNHFPQLPLFGSLQHYGLNHYEGIGGASAESVNLGFQMGGAAPHHFPPFLTSFDNNSSSSLFPLQLRSMETTQPAAASSVKEERNQEEVMNLISKPFTFLGISETTNNNTATTNNNNNHYWPAGENGWTDFGDLN